jgi:uncharacterized protein YacL
MHGFLFVRGLFIAAVVYAAMLIQPLQAHLAINAALGLAVALLFVFAETRLRDAAVTHLLGGLIGFGIGLSIASSIQHSLFWADTSDTKVRFVHLLILLILPYVGMVLGARKGEWLEPAKLASLFRDARPAKRYRILDTSVIIDGRIADLVEGGFLEGTIVVPRFVLKELQLVADSGDPIRRARGRRGLEMLSRIQRGTRNEVKIHEIDFPEESGVDAKLVRLTRALSAKLFTNDYNLGKIAELQSVSHINIHELARAMKPAILPGESFNLKIVREGKDKAQGVGYLNDGTMVVVNNAHGFIGQQIDVQVQSLVQTGAGVLVFADVKTPVAA